MTGKTHLIAGILAAEYICATNGTAGKELAFSAFVTASASLGALLPDIDHTKSKISTLNRNTRNSSWIIRKLFHHRGPVHSPAVLALLLAAAWLGGLLNSAKAFCLAEAFAAGWLTHLVLDSLNPAGILWAWPLSRKRIRLAKIRTGSFGESILTVSMLMLLLACAKEVPAFRTNLGDCWEAIRQTAVSLWDRLPQLLDRLCSLLRG